jgi:hypothetical protein
MLRRTSKSVKELHDRAVSQIHKRHVQLTEPSPGPLPPPEHLQLQSYHHCNTSAGESERRLLRISGLSGPFLGGCCDGSAISPEEKEKFLQGPPGETQEEWHKQPAFMHRYRRSQYSIAHHLRTEDAQEIIYLVLVQESNEHRKMKRCGGRSKASGSYPMATHTMGCFMIVFMSISRSLFFSLPQPGWHRDRELEGAGCSVWFSHYCCLGLGVRRFPMHCTKKSMCHFL